MTDRAASERNRQIVREAFERWAAGEGSAFDLLADDATWTIAGSGPFARTWRGRQAYIDAAVTPLLDRLAATVPRVLGVWADADEVIVRWQQDTPIRAGGRYRNGYAWFFTMRDGKAVAVTAFLDLDAFRAVMGQPMADHQFSPVAPEDLAPYQPITPADHKDGS